MIPQVIHVQQRTNREKHTRIPSRVQIRLSANRSAVSFTRHLHSTLSRPRGSGASSHHHTAVTVSPCPADPAAAAADQTCQREIEGGTPPFQIPSSYSDAPGFTHSSGGVSFPSVCGSQHCSCLIKPTLLLPKHHPGAPSSHLKSAGTVEDRSAPLSGGTGGCDTSFQKHGPKR